MIKVEIEVEVEEEDGIVSCTTGFSTGLSIVISSLDFSDNDNDDDDDVEVDIVVFVVVVVVVVVVAVVDSQQGNTMFPLMRRVSTGEKGSTGSKKEGNIA